MTETVTKPDAEPELDEELLAEAQRHLGGSFRNEALNAALRQFVDEQRARRRQALAELRRMSDEGLFDYTALEEADR